jgi:uncharacterized membrane protein YeaQ/YmgE (transglycosylase-associated protein family)
VKFFNLKTVNLHSLSIINKRIQFMLEQLFNLIKQESQQDIIENPQIPNEQNNQAVGLATDSIFNGLQSALAGGGLTNILNMFSGKSNMGINNPIVGGIANNFVNGLMGKLGISGPIAQSIAGALIPKVLGKLVGRTSDPADNGFNINSLIGSLIGVNSNQGNPVQLQNNQGFDFNSLLNSLTGNQAVQPNIHQDAPANDGFGLDDIIKMVGGGGQAATNGGGGGLQDIFNMVTNGAKQQHQQQSNNAGGGGIMDLLKGVMGN